MTWRRFRLLWCARVWPDTLGEALIILVSAWTTGFVLSAILSLAIWLAHPS